MTMKTWTAGEELKAADLNANFAQAGGAKGGSDDKVFWENDQDVTADYEITTGQNAMTAGPITIASGITVTVPSGSEWTVV